ncbi:GPI ethanolamine phosphate transferase 3 [Auxenochlorella protothecoides]|uniref:GPI ethanolamine phosphate transferase 3 n=1 Tax=Auxenochlorella protothecoides TaxID=3075 RepID=A0A087SD53_AUXPR|nr:GPI ethanolamine phosphate transferase 3 [Auxenochlorella protothecoides]KFM23657.1 GPI ethanolamine phosphate transferase 3 [Auxenochlorella protothecoides]
MQAKVARSFRFLAEAPTTTLQRLKCLMTGGLPSFFDIGNSFSAGPLDEDNLVDQAVAAGKRVAFVGDTTWTQLFPRQFSAAHPFPCFNVRDLHSVDEGVAAQLPALLAAPGSWDLLIGHTLGVDHAGHAHGVASAQMLSKLAQTDALVQGWVDAMLEVAGPGQAYERTLLLVLGDHGQTLTGEHGGGSDPEVDSALVAVSLGALARSPPAQTAAQASAGFPIPVTGVMVQADFAATLAPLLGLPTPYCNLGRVHRDLFQLGASNGKDLEIAAWANVEQVVRYLEAYALAAYFPKQVLGRVLQEHADLLGDRETSKKGSEAEAGRALDFLELASRLARPQWTQFGTTSMVLGLVAVALALAAQALGAYVALAPRGIEKKPKAPVSTLTSVPRLLSLGTAICAAVPVLGIFSFFYLLNEGTWTAGVAAAAWVLLTLESLTTLKPRTQTLLAILMLGGAGLLALLLSARLGLTQHSGWGFWQKLTVHDKEPAAHLGANVSWGAQLLASGTDHITRLAGKPSSWAGCLLVAGFPAALLGMAVCALSMHVPGVDPAAANILASARLARLAVAASFAAAAARHVVQGAVDAGVAASDAPLSALLAWAPGRLFQTDGGYVQPATRLFARVSLSTSGLALLSLALNRRVLRSHPGLLPAGLAALVALLSPPSTSLAMLCMLGWGWVAAYLPAVRRRSCLAQLQLVLAAMHAFYASGHLCEFAGVHWTAGFVTDDDFHLYRSGAIAMMGTLRCAAALAAMLSAAVQRRHLYAWSLFAPRFAFEACFLVVTDITVLLMNVLLV